MTARLAFLSLWRRPARHAVLILLLTAACALPVFLLQMAAGLYSGLNRAVEPFPILMGANGSPYQLVIHTVFLRDRPIGNISYAAAERIRAGGRADRVIPLAFGDNYRGFPIVGTETEIFDYRPNPSRGPWLTLAEGRLFAAPGEAVIGSEAARRTGLAVGDTFRGLHGLAGPGKEHESYRVAGILEPVGGPYDTALFLDISDIWRAHGHEGAGKGDVTALLIHPKSYRDTLLLLQEAQQHRGGATQLLFPAQTLIALYSLAGQSREFWTLFTGGFLLAAVLITLLAMYWNALSRLSEFALLRALGAGRGAVMRLLAAEQAILLTAGALAGWLAGWGAAVLAARAVSAKAAIVMTITPEWQTLIPPLAVCLLGVFTGLIPAWRIRKQDMSAHL